MHISFISLILVRWKRLKGGRKVARSIKTVKCRAPIHTEADGSFRTIISCKAGVFVMAGKSDPANKSFGVYEYKIVARKNRYLRKGFDDILGYNLNTVSING